MAMSMSPTTGSPSALSLSRWDCARTMGRGFLETDLEPAVVLGGAAAGLGREVAMGAALVFAIPLEAIV